MKEGIRPFFRNSEEDWIQRRRDKAESKTNWFKKKRESRENRSEDRGDKEEKLEIGSIGQE